MRYSKLTMLKYLNAWAMKNGCKPIKIFTLDFWRKQNVVAPPKLISRGRRGKKGIFRDWAGESYQTARIIMKLSKKGIREYRRQRLYLCLISKGEFIPLKRIKQDFKSVYIQIIKRLNRENNRESLSGNLAIKAMKLSAFIAQIPELPADLRNLIPLFLDKKFCLNLLRQTVYPQQKEKEIKGIDLNLKTHPERFLQWVVVLILLLFGLIFPPEPQDSEFLKLVDDVFEESGEEPSDVLYDARNFTYLLSQFFVKIVPLGLHPTIARKKGIPAEVFREFNSRGSFKSEYDKLLDMSVLFFPPVLLLVKSNDESWKHIMRDLSYILKWYEKLPGKRPALSVLVKYPIHTPEPLHPVTRLLLGLFLGGVTEHDEDPAKCN